MNEKNDPHYARKIIATIVDYTIVFLSMYFWIKEFGEPNSEGGYTASGIYALPPIVFWIILLPMSESLFSATLGHWMVGLRIVDESGFTPDFFMALKRRIADIIDLPFFAIPAFIAIERTPMGQRLGDLWARTVVIDREVKKNMNNSG